MHAHAVLLVVHAIAGTLGLVLGPVAAGLSARQRDSHRWTAGYQGAVTLVCVTALGLVALAPETFWWLTFFAVGTQAAIVVARRTDSAVLRTRLLGGSYVSLVTALLVVSWDNPLAWIVPTVLGVGLVERAAARTGQRRSAHAP